TLSTTHRSTLFPYTTLFRSKWHTPEFMKKLSDSDFHKLLAEKKFQLIYTTNYDQWIEKAFDLYSQPYTKISHISHISNTKKNVPDRKSTRLNSSHVKISYAV